VKRIAIVTASGVGKRFPGTCKKQFRTIAGRPVLAYAIDNFVHNKEIDGIVVTVPYNEIEQTITQLHALYQNSDIQVVEGGETRQKSVLRALNTLSLDTNIVLIHDGVRPFVNEAELMEMLRICYEVDAVIPVHKVKNTIKEVSENKVVRTLFRNSLVEVYTPQIFRYDMILKYHRLADQQGLSFTDDASIIEHYGMPVYTYETEQVSLKITDESDFNVAKIIIENNIADKKVR